MATQFFRVTLTLEDGRYVSAKFAGQDAVDATQRYKEYVGAQAIEQGVKLSPIVKVSTRIPQGKVGAVVFRTPTERAPKKAPVAAPAPAVAAPVAAKAGK